MNGTPFTTRDLLVKALTEFDLGRPARAHLVLEEALKAIKVGGDLTAGVALGYMDPDRKRGVKWNHKGHFDSRKNRRVGA